MQDHPKKINSKYFIRRFPWIFGFVGLSVVSLFFISSRQLNHDRNVETRSSPMTFVIDQGLTLITSNPTISPDMQKFIQAFLDNRNGRNLTQICPHLDKDTLFQVSTLNALTNGDYDGHLSFGELKKKGDFGLGTFVGIDGEMIEDTGNIFQALPDGTASLVSDDAETPFSVATFFEPDQTFDLGGEPLDLEHFSQALDSRLPDKSLFYAIRVTGEFSYLKTRSIPKQQKPYAHLAELVKTQPTLEFQDQVGTLVGFWLPDYMKGINATGYHFHFLSEGQTSGGHLLALQTNPSKPLRVEIDTTCGLEIRLP